MDPFNGIVVQIVSNGEILDLYDDPDAADNDNDNTRQHYVEAMTDETFTVKVMLTTAFRLHHLRSTDAVKIMLNLDGNRVDYFIELSRKEIEDDLLKGKPGGYEFTTSNDFCLRTGQWMQSEFKFGKLDFSESTKTKPTAERVKDLGRIRISVQRMFRTLRKVPKPPEMVPWEVIKEVPEKALKGRGVANTVALANTRPGVVPKPREYDCEPLRGSKGKAIKFNIFYRSRSMLQMLGCISRSPSPAVEISDDERDSHTPLGDDNAREVSQELQQLRARLALLERSSNIKTEAGSSVKREREDDKHSGRRQRPRTSVKVETIDLTDD